MPPKRPRSVPPPAAPAHAPRSAPAPPTRDATPAGYAAFFAEVAARVRAAQLKAAAAVDRELIALYWDSGREIVARQHREGWGAAVIARLSADLRRECPGARGFSERNVRSARAFYLAYAPAEPPAAAPSANRQQPVAEMGGPPTAGLAAAGPPPAVAAIPWAHNLLLLEKLDAPALRVWYVRQNAPRRWAARECQWAPLRACARLGWSRSSPSSRPLHDMRSGCRMCRHETDVLRLMLIGLGRGSHVLHVDVTGGTTPRGVVRGCAPRPWVRSGCDSRRPLGTWTWPVA